MEKIEQFSAVTLRLQITALLPEDEQQAPVRREFEFIYGVEHQVPTLEKSLLGVRAGYSFSFKISPEALYGAHDPELIREMPKEGLLKQRVREGKYYRQLRKGSRVEFKVLEIRPDTVLADLNKPMAGVSALMEGEVLAVRKASEAEISKAEDDERKREIGCG